MEKLNGDVQLRDKSLPALLLCNATAFDRDFFESKTVFCPILQKTEKKRKIKLLFMKVIKQKKLDNK